MVLLDSKNCLRTFLKRKEFCLQGTIGKEKPHGDAEEDSNSTGQNWDTSMIPSRLHPLGYLTHEPLPRLKTRLDVEDSI